MPTIEGRYLLDTNVLIYATLHNDPRAEPARRAIEQGSRADCEAFLSVQNLAEMYPNLTGPKTQPTDTPAEASEKIRRLAALPHVQVLPVTPAVIEKALELAELHQTRRQKFFDMQLAATLLLHDIPLLVTENESDFAAIQEIRTLNPFI
jgi:predicted nucleic acid-binding protein